MGSSSVQRIAAQWVLARGKAKKDVGHGGLDEWFSGHGKGKSKSKGKATWGDWVSISPIKKKLKKPDGGTKQINPGDIVGPCGISKKKEWKEFTNNGKDPLKCMPRQKAYDTPKTERADIAKGKMRAEKKDKDKGKKPTYTRTFKKKKAGNQNGSNLPVADRWLHHRYQIGLKRAVGRSKTAGWWTIDGSKPPVDKGALMNAVPGTDPANAAMYTGDDPADHTGKYLDEIDIIYRTVWGRPAHPEELAATFLFSFRPVAEGATKLNDWFDDFIRWYGVAPTKITWPLEVWDQISWFFLQCRNAKYFKGRKLPNLWGTLEIMRDDLTRLNQIEYPGDSAGGRMFLDAVLKKFEVLREHWLDCMFPPKDHGPQYLAKRIAVKWLGEVVCG